MGKRRLPAGLLPTFPASEVALSMMTTPARSHAADLVTSPVPSIIVQKTMPPSRAPSPESLRTTGAMTPLPSAKRTSPSRRRTMSPRKREQVIASVIGASAFAICLVAAALVAVFASTPPSRVVRRAERRAIEVTFSPAAQTPLVRKVARSEAPAHEPVAVVAQPVKTTSPAKASKPSAAKSSSRARKPSGPQSVARRSAVGTPKAGPAARGPGHRSGAPARAASQRGRRP